jgi:hypothetical protein
VLRRIPGHKRDEIIGCWRTLHNEKLCNLHSSPNIIRMMKSRRVGWAGHVAHMQKKRSACKVLIGKPGRKGPLEIPRNRLEGNTKIDVEEMIGMYGLDSPASR